MGEHITESTQFEWMKGYRGNAVENTFTIGFSGSGKWLLDHIF